MICFQCPYHRFQQGRFMKDILWVIQDSGGRHYNWVALMNAIKQCNSKGIFCKIEDLKYLKNNKLNIVIGGDDFLEEAEKNIDIESIIFHDEKFFNISNYENMWKENFLNHGFRAVPFEKLHEISRGQYFIRPVHDNKCFDGKIYMIPEDIPRIEKLCSKDRCKYRDQPCLCLAQVRNIELEWRAVIINSQIITACQYAEKSGTLINKENIPDSLMEFCKKQIQNISAPIAWVIDIAYAEKEYKILECNIFNASNFYDCDRKAIVEALENYSRKEVDDFR